MSEGVGEFPHTLPSSEQTRAHGPDRRPEREGSFLVAQANAVAQKEYLLRSARKPFQLGDQLLRKSLVVEASVRLPREIRLRFRQPEAVERRTVSAVRTSPVTHDVVRDSEQPRTPQLGPNAPSSTPRLQEDDGDQVLRGRPIADSPEAVVVDECRVALKEPPKCVGIASLCARPKCDIRGRVVRNHGCYSMSARMLQVPSFRLAPHAR